MTEGVWIAVIAAVVNVVTLLIEGRKTRKANKEDNVRTKNQISEKLDESQNKG